MTEDQMAKLESIKNFHTRYEVEVVRTADGARRLVCYTPRKSRRGLADAIGQRASSIKAFLGLGEQAMGDFRGTTEYLVFPNVGSIRFSGRTQRDAILAGELTYVVEEVADKAA
jgi:hypothetical protein